MKSQSKKKRAQERGWVWRLKLIGGKWGNGRLENGGMANYVGGSNRES